MSGIKEARLAAGLTQRQMSDFMGIPKRTIENWEGGQRSCPPYIERLILKELAEIQRETKKNDQQ
jgi:transcriptional regulator with XRE-family HTH domain